ncbi:MAG TPA: flagellar basal body P-ring protein FlgI [Syntrophales bacterium]|nr:flagellar basal body P-ring protein FlgI [Syntrophales bacterium]HRT61041.1 flagellar basal body P-ring protein FlgI [Syntrophales bacterium]
MKRIEKMRKQMALRSVWFLPLLALFLVSTAEAARIKDIAGIGGIRDNQLIGYGLVVGLAGTGDDVKNGFTRETLSNLLVRQGLSTRDRVLTSKNIAAVMVTAQLPPFAKIGSKLDVTVSSLGDAKSLQGGTLLMTPLRGADGEIYAVAQGAVTVGGFSAAGASGSSVSKNHTTAGNIANGALIEKELKYDLADIQRISINLYQPDFTTATRLAASINGKIGAVEAKAVDSGSVLVEMKPSARGDVASLVSLIENIEVSIDGPAVVVLNERTGTVVMGENVRISTVAVAHGNLSIQIREEKEVSQPMPFAPEQQGRSAPVDAGGGVTVAPGGQTVVTPRSEVGVSEEKKGLLVMPRGVTIQDVVRGLNAMGVSPRDLITILQTIKAAGALQADLKIL